MLLFVFYSVKIILFLILPNFYCIYFKLFLSNLSNSTIAHITTIIIIIIIIVLNIVIMFVLMLLFVLSKIVIIFNITTIFYIYFILK